MNENDNSKSSGAKSCALASAIFCFMETFFCFLAFLLFALITLFVFIDFLGGDSNQAISVNAFGPVVVADGPSFFPVVLWAFVSFIFLIAASLTLYTGIVNIKYRNDKSSNVKAGVLAIFFCYGVGILTGILTIILDNR